MAQIWDLLTIVANYLLAGMILQVYGLIRILFDKFLWFNLGFGNDPRYKLHNVGNTGGEQAPTNHEIRCKYKTYVHQPGFLVHVHVINVALNIIFFPLIQTYANFYYILHNSGSSPSHVVPLQIGWRCTLPETNIAPENRPLSHQNIRRWIYLYNYQIYVFQLPKTLTNRGFQPVHSSHPVFYHSPGCEVSAHLFRASGAVPKIFAPRSCQKFSVGRRHDYG